MQFPAELVSIRLGSLSPTVTRRSALREIRKFCYSTGGTCLRNAATRRFSSRGSHNSASEQAKYRVATASAVATRDVPSLSCGNDAQVEAMRRARQHGLSPPIPRAPASSSSLFHTAAAEAHRLHDEFCFLDDFSSVRFDWRKRATSRSGSGVKTRRHQHGAPRWRSQHHSMPGEDSSFYHEISVYKQRLLLFFISS